MRNEQPTDEQLRAEREAFHVQREPRQYTESFKRAVVEAIRGGMSSRDVETQFDVCRSNATRWARAVGVSNKREPAVPKAAIVAMLSAGKNGRDIAKELSVSQKRVTRIRRELGAQS